MSAADPLHPMITKLRKTILRAWDRAGTMPAKESVKVHPADWHAIRDQVDALVAALQALETPDQMQQDPERTDAGDPALASVAAATPPKDRDELIGVIENAVMPYVDARFADRDCATDVLEALVSKGWLRNPEDRQET